MKPTRLELVDRTSSKFWEVSTEGATLVVRFGRIGTNGQTKKKTLASAAAAKAEADKLLAEKVRKGYSEKAAAKAATKKATATKGVDGLAAKLTEVVPKLFEVNKRFAQQSGIDDDETFEEALGKPCKAGEIFALEERLKTHLTPSHRAFLSVYGHWRGFAGGADILGPEEHASAHIQKTIRDKSALFDEFAPTNPFKRGAYPLAIGDSRSMILVEPSPKRKGAWDFVTYHLTEEESRYPDLVTLFEEALKETTGWLLKPAKQPTRKKLEGLLEELSNTASTGGGRDLRIKWKGGKMDSIELRTSKNGAAIEQLMQLDSAKNVTTLILGGTNDYTRAVKALAKSSWPTELVRLSIGHQRWGDMIPGENKLGELSPSYPKLTDLDVTLGNAKLGKIALPSLTTLTLRGANAAQWKAIAAARFPKLERLAVRFHQNAMFMTALGGRLRMPKLKTLAVHVWRDDQVEPLVAAIARSPLARSLGTLQIVFPSGDGYLLKKVQNALAAKGVRLRAERGRDTER